MKKLILVPACLALALGLFGCQPPAEPYKYRVWYQGVPVEFDSPYDDPAMYRGGGGPGD